MRHERNACVVKIERKTVNELTDGGHADENR